MFAQKVPPESVAEEAVVAETAAGEVTAADAAAGTAAKAATVMREAHIANAVRLRIRHISADAMLRKVSIPYSPICH